jgi:spermidine synthase
MSSRSRASLIAQKREKGTATLMDAKRIAAALLFMSGAAALVYQVLWAKQLSIVVGVDIHAITIAVSAFFAGLGFGGLLIGRLAEGIALPVRFYAGLELGVAASGFAVTWALARLPHCLPSLRISSSGSPG